MKKTLIMALVIVAVIFALIVIFSSFYVVPENEYACTVRFSKIIATTDEPGFISRCRLDSVRSFPKAIMFTTYRRRKC